MLQVSRREKVRVIKQNKTTTNDTVECNPLAASLQIDKVKVRKNWSSLPPLERDQLCPGSCRSQWGSAPGCEVHLSLTSGWTPFFLKKPDQQVCPRAMLAEEWIWANQPIDEHREAGMHGWCASSATSVYAMLAVVNEPSSAKWRRKWIPNGVCTSRGCRRHPSWRTLPNDSTPPPP